MDRADCVRMSQRIRDFRNDADADAVLPVGPIFF
jgi:hypothetical protein